MHIMKTTWTEGGALRFGVSSLNARLRVQINERSVDAHERHTEGATLLPVLRLV